MYFALDELNFGDILRCDIVAVGIYKGVAYPVLIELKSDRLQTRLIDQLNNFFKEINEYGLKKEFAELLKECSNIGKEVNIDRKGMMVIWNKNDYEKKGTLEKFDKEK